MKAPYIACTIMWVVVFTFVGFMVVLRDNAAWAWLLLILLPSVHHAKETKQE